MCGINSRYGAAGRGWTPLYASRLKTVLCAAQPDRNAAVPSARGGHAIASIGSKVYCFGGADRSPTPFNDLWELDTGNNVQNGSCSLKRVKQHTGCCCMFKICKAAPPYQCCSHIDRLDRTVRLRVPLHKFPHLQVFDSALAHLLVLYRQPTACMDTHTSHSCRQVGICSFAGCDTQHMFAQYARCKNRFVCCAEGPCWHAQALL